MIIVINGPCGVGKTEVAARLNELLDRSVMLDGDYLGHVHPFEIYSAERIDHLYSTFAVNIAHHQRYGYEHFIVNYVFESEKSLKDLLRRLQPLCADIFTFRLHASVEENQRRIRKRATDSVEWELKRCVELQQTMEPLGDAVGERIDVTELNVDTVARLILGKVDTYQAMQLPEFDFGGQYVEWIYGGEKRSTTRLIKSDDAGKKFRAGDFCLATSKENDLAFAILRIDAVHELGWAELDDNLAQSENFSNIAQLQKALRQFYPEAGPECRFRVYQFTCVHYLDAKLN